MVEILSHYIIQFIQSSSYIGIFVLMTLESALIPIPSEVTMPFSGFLVSKSQLSFPLVILAGAFGNLAGSLIAYGLGYYLEDAVILGLIKKYGKFFLVSEHEYIKSIHWFNKYGSGIAFFSRMLPAVRTFISLPAGMAKMNLLKFSVFTFAGSLIWSVFLTYIGIYLGNRWNSLEVYFRRFQILIAVFIVFTILFYVNHKLKIVKLPN